MESLNYDFTIYYWIRSPSNVITCWCVIILYHLTIFYFYFLTLIRLVASSSLSNNYIKGKSKSNASWWNSFLPMSWLLKMSIYVAQDFFYCSFEQFYWMLTIIIIISSSSSSIYTFRDFHISVSWSSFTGVWLTPSPLKSPEFFSVFWPFTKML